MSIGSQIALYRKSLKMTQEELGQLVGVSNQAVSKWELDVTLPDVLLLPRIVKALNITFDQLYEIEERTIKQITADNFPEIAFDILHRFFFDNSKFRFTHIDKSDEEQYEFQKLSLEKGKSIACFSNESGCVFINDTFSFIDKHFKEIGEEKIFESAYFANILNKLSDCNFRKVISYVYNHAFSNNRKSTWLFMANVIPKECGLDEEEVAKVINDMVSLKLCEIDYNDKGEMECYFKTSEFTYVIGIYKLASFLSKEKVFIALRDTTTISDYVF